MSDFQNIVSQALEIASKHGAQDARIRVGRSQSLDISWRKGKLENMTSSGESALVLKLFVDGKYGSYFTSDMRPECIESFIAKCIDITRLLEADPARTLPDPEYYKDRSEEDLELFDPSVEATTPNDVIEYCKNLEALTLAHSELPILDATIECGVSQNESYMASTNGFSGARKGSFFSAYSSIVMTDGDKKPSDYANSSARFKADLRTPQQIADEAARYAAFKLGQKKLPTANRTLIFDRRVAAKLIGNYIDPLDGWSLVLKSSYFQDKIGQKFGSDLLDLYDDPFIKRGAGSRTYDPEGITAKKATLFEKGTLKQYFLDTYAANKLGLKPTTGSMSNIVLTPGTRGLDAMIADVKDGIYVTGLLGGNQDDVRGDFSHGIVGVAIENGKLTTPVSEMNITGNHLELWNRLSEVGNDFRTDASSRIPSIRIDDVAVSGS
ncbi:MAG: TldD/PmbA family protein [Proteobacteria bacterium]|nr:TldD/PmbA family protein [Pseudomonadota bacterium]